MRNNAPIFNHVIPAVISLKFTWVANCRRLIPLAATGPDHNLNIGLARAKSATAWERGARCCRTSVLELRRTTDLRTRARSPPATAQPAVNVVPARNIVARKKSLVLEPFKTELAPLSRRQKLHRAASWFCRDLPMCSIDATVTMRHTNSPAEQPVHKKARTNDPGFLNTRFRSVL